MKRIGELLVENHIITKESLDAALARQSELSMKKPVGEILVEMKVITIDSLIKYLDIQLREKFNR
jgi:hypothetical protein